jgi:beta-lactamase regulating signal transducer with metallopeptidase domain
MASVAVLVLLLIRGPARRWFGAHIAYRLWAAVPLAAMGAMMPLDYDPGADGPIAAATSGLRAWLAAADHGRLILSLWLAGVAVSLAVAALRQSRFLAAERRGVAGPAAVGVIQPRLVAPSDFARRYTPAEWRLIRAHERAHIDRLDGRSLAMAVLGRSLCWFNPLAPLALKAFRVDQEIACDATVMERLPYERKRYAETLLHAHPAWPPPVLGAALRSPGAGVLETRIDMLTRPILSLDRLELGLELLALSWIAAFLLAWANEPAWRPHQPNPFAGLEAALPQVDLPEKR